MAPTKAEARAFRLARLEEVRKRLHGEYIVGVVAEAFMILDRDGQEAMAKTARIQLKRLHDELKGE